MAAPFRGFGSYSQSSRGEFMNARTLRMLSLAFLLCVSGLALAAEGHYGNYRVSDDHLLGIDRFTADDGQDTMLISDYSSGVVRRLFPVSATEFVMGPGFSVAS